MIKLMIVDDEIEILKNLRKCIDWETWDITLAADAANACEGLAKALECMPDILICDIQMPGKDGLSFCSELKKLLPKLKIIILSGYNDSEYLHRALRMGVNEYLLKPIEIDTIVPAVLKMKEELLATRSREQQEQLRNKLLHESIQTLRLQYISNLLNAADADSSPNKERAELLGIPLCGPCFQVALLRILPKKTADSNSDVQLSMEFYQLNQKLDQNQTEIPQSFYCEIKENDYLWLVNAETSEEAEEKIQALIRISKKSLPPKHEFLIGVGSCVDQFQQISTSYHHASSALNCSIWDAAKHTFFYQPVTETVQDTGKELDHLERQILDAILEKKWDSCMDLFSEAYSLCQKQNASLDPLREICRHIMLIIRPAGPVQPVAVRSYHIDEIYYADDLKNWIFSCIKQYSENKKPHNYLPIVKKAVQYIHLNYQHDITLQKLSKELFVTPNYLGKLFHQEIGCKMTDYLNRYRIEQAKELLKDPTLKTSEIAERVGFTSYKYFLVVFAKYTNQNIREYRTGDGYY